MNAASKVANFFLLKKKKQDAKLWGDTAKGRFIKQHGSVDEIPEGDAHAVPKYTDPTLANHPSPEEVKIAAEKLEEEIQALKNPHKQQHEQQGHQGQTQPPQNPQKKGFYDDWVD